MRINDKQNTKIVATVGPASSSPAKLRELVVAGVDIFRLNFSHGKHEDHEKVIKRITEINEEYNINIGILADLQGPKLRIGVMKDEPVILEKDDIIEFTNEKIEGTKERAYM
ncbi:MAG: pyruvate kinase, partial [Saprospiraceae bacterium]|nr:pyruvate kinase [Saprospiraceae bacterium]